MRIFFLFYRDNYHIKMYLGCPQKSSYDHLELNIVIANMADIRGELSKLGFFFNDYNIKNGTDWQQFFVLHPTTLIKFLHTNKQQLNWFVKTSKNWDYQVKYIDNNLDVFFYPYSLFIGFRYTLIYVRLTIFMSLHITWKRRNYEVRLKGLRLNKKLSEKQDSFSLLFTTLPFDINDLGPVMLYNCNPIME